MREAKRELGTIAVIGGGFSGVVTAVHLLRGGLGGPAQILLVNRSGRMARGVAYGTRTEAHVLNVAAGRMSALAEDEDSFLRFVRARAARRWRILRPPAALRRLPRRAAEEAIADHPGGVRRMVGEVVAIERDDPVCADLTLADGRTLRAHRVVLAVGNYAPATPAPTAILRQRALHR